MEKKKVLKLIFRQPSAHYRVAFTQQHVHRSLPLPPPSTIIGMIHNLMDCKNGESLKGFDIAICGNYESLFYQYQLFRNIHKTYQPAYKEVHLGSPMPNQVQLLFNVYIRIYIAFDDTFNDVNQITKDKFIEKLSNPGMPFIIGRREDLAILEIREIKQSEVIFSEFPEHLLFSHWINEKMADDYGLHGPVYQLGTFYKIQEKVRNFERHRFYYIEPQPLEPKKKGNKYEEPTGWVDRTEIDGEVKNIPVFFLGLNQLES